MTHRHVDEAWNTMFGDEEETKVDETKDKKKGSHASWWYELTPEQQAEVKRKRVASAKKTWARKKADKKTAKQDRQDVGKAQDSTEIQRLTALMFTHVRSLSALAQSIEESFGLVLGEDVDQDSKYEVYDDPKSDLGRQLNSLDTDLVGSLNKLQSILDRNQL